MLIHEYICWVHRMIISILMDASILWLQTITVSLYWFLVGCCMWYIVIHHPLSVEMSMLHSYYRIMKARLIGWIGIETPTMMMFVPWWMDWLGGTTAWVMTCLHDSDVLYGMKRSLQVLGSAHCERILVAGIRVNVWWLFWMCRASRMTIRVGIIWFGLGALFSCLPLSPIGTYGAWVCCWNIAASLNSLNFATSI